MQKEQVPKKSDWFTDEVVSAAEITYLAISLQMIRDVISVQRLLVVTANEVFLENIKLGFHFVKCATNTVKSNNTHFIY